MRPVVFEFEVDFFADGNVLFEFTSGPLEGFVAAGDLEFEEVFVGGGNHGFDGGEGICFLIVHVCIEGKGFLGLGRTEKGAGMSDPLKFFI